MSDASAYDPNNIFAKILRGEAPCHKVFEDEIALAFMDIMPRVEGHTLVIPKIAARGLLDMPPPALGPYMERVQRVAAAALKAFAADGLTIQQFNETAGGQMVFHLHVHILPRHTGIAVRPPGAMGDAAVVQANAEKLRLALA